MKIFTVLFSLLLFSFSLAQDHPHITYLDLTIAAEQNSQLLFDARKLADKINLPHTIYTPDGVFIEARGIENGKVVYVIVNDVADAINSGSVAYWDDIQANYDLSKARIHYLNQPTQNPSIGYPEITDGVLATSYLAIPDWTTDAVVLLDPITGDLIDNAFIVDPTNLSSPKQIRSSPYGFLTLSDQADDLVQKYDTAGTYLGYFAPNSGVNTAILDNIRGHNFRPNGNMVVTVGSSGNQNGVAEFDASGNYLGNFIAIGAGGLNSPFDILFRTNDCLVTASTSNAAHRYDLNGNYLDNFIPSIAFPQQMFEATNGNILVAGFSVPSALYIYNSTGTLLNSFNVVTGLRGCYQLPGGNYIVTNGSSIAEIDDTTGALVRNIVTGISAQYVNLIDFAIVPVELTSFTGSSIDGNVVLNWNTATEVNNSGFEIQRSTDRINFLKVSFISGFGTTTEPKNYTYTDNSVNNGKYFYRLKQIDFNGEFAYSDIVEVEVTVPKKFKLFQNYPNPFNPSTLISYNIPQNSFVTIKVYDVIGNEVATLVNQTQDAGKYDISFDASNLSNGVYFYSIKAGNFSSTKKMILMK